MAEKLTCEKISTDCTQEAKHETGHIIGYLIADILNVTQK